VLYMTFEKILKLQEPGTHSKHIHDIPYNSDSLSLFVGQLQLKIINDILGGNICTLIPAFSWIVKGHETVDKFNTITFGFKQGAFYNGSARSPFPSIP